MKHLKSFESVYDNMEVDPFSEVVVQVLDMDALNEDITRDVKDYMKANDAIKAREKEKSTYFVRGPLCILTSEKGTKALVDKELIGSIEENNLFPISIYEKGESGGEAMFPAFNSKFSVKELEKFVVDEKFVKDFMGSRYDYNDRIQGNQRDFYNFFKTK